MFLSLLSLNGRKFCDNSGVKLRHGNKFSLRWTFWTCKLKGRQRLGSSKRGGQPHLDNREQCGLCGLPRLSGRKPGWCHLPSNTGIQNVPCRRPSSHGSHTCVTRTCSYMTEHVIRFRKCFYIAPNVHRGVIQNSLTTPPLSG